MDPALYLPNGKNHAPARSLMDKLFVELHSDVFGKKSCWRDTSIYNEFQVTCSFQLYSHAVLPVSWSLGPSLTRFFMRSSLVTPYSFAQELTPF